MDFTGKVLRALETRTGTNEKGDWSVQSFYFEELGKEKPDSIVVDVWKAELRDWLLRNMGATVTITISSKAREYQGRMYNNLSCWRVSHMGKDVPTGQQAKEQTYKPQQGATLQEDGELPF